MNTFFFSNTAYQSIVFKEIINYNMYLPYRKQSKQPHILNTRIHTSNSFPKSYLIKGKYSMLHVACMKKLDYLVRDEF